MGTHPIWYWIWAAAAFVFVAVCASIFRRLSERRASREEVERERVEALVAADIEAGIRLTDGHLACCICGTKAATHRLPMIGLSMFERLNPLRDLYGSLHLYRRVDDIDATPSVCAAHRDLYASFLDAELAEVRRLAAGFATTVDRRISDLRSGVLLSAAKEYATEQRRPMMATQSLPLLSGPEEVAVSTQQTTNGKRLDARAEVINVEATN